MDFVDMSELVLDEVESDLEDDCEEREQIRRRGKDIDWVLEDHYSNENDFIYSEFKNEMDKEMTQKKDTERMILGLNIGFASILIKEVFFLVQDN